MGRGRDSFSQYYYWPQFQLHNVNWGIGGRYFGNLCYAIIVILIHTVLHNLVSCIAKHLLSIFK